MDVIARRIGALSAQGLFLLALFVVVVGLSVGINTGLQAAGFKPAMALLIAGIVVVAVVIGLTIAYNTLALAMRAAQERRRAALGLPAGACCLVWRGVPLPAMPWRLVHPIAAAYPKLAQRLGVEGLAVLEFEIGADGAPKSIRCPDYWPHTMFKDAAIDALSRARFRSKGPVMRLNESYRLPFVFRIKGAAQVRDPRTVRAKKHRA